MEIEESRIMGIDYGRKRIGIALSDPLKTFAYSHSVVSNDQNKFLQLGKIISEKSIIKIILGIPNEERISKNSIVDDVKKFKDELISNFKLEVLLWDETYTSIMAEKKMIESVSSKKKRRDKSLIDMNSAAIILQEYLNSIS
jgi:putative Holliday junction resolvase